MKAIPKAPKSDAFKSAIEREVLKRELAIRTSTAQQLTAAFLYTLDKFAGYKSKRLKRIFEAVTDTFENSSSFGREFDAVDLISWCKDIHGIDLAKEINVELEIKDKGEK